MAGGAFNVAALIRQLGLKRIRGDEMRVLETIQPTLSVGELADLTPQHRTPSVLVGVDLVGLALEHGIVELQCLSLGGGFITDLYMSAAASVFVRVATTPAVIGVPVPVVPAGVLSADPIVSNIVLGSGANLGPPRVALKSTGKTYFGTHGGLFIPRGSFFQIQVQSVAATSIASFVWREIPAAETIS